MLHIIAVFLLSNCIAEQVPNIPAEDYLYIQPPSLNDGLIVSTPSNEGLKQTYITNLVKSILSNEHGEIDSVLIARHNRLVVEEYFNAYTRSDPHDLRSITKSITSLLTGIARNQGFVDLDTTVYDNFPEYNAFDHWHPQKLDIQVKHLLTMSSGLDCRDNDAASPGDEAKMYRFSDWIKYTLDLPVKDTPGKVWSYCTGGVNVLGGLLENRIGTDFQKFAQQNFFSKLDIHNYHWSRAPNGKTEASGHIYLTSRAMMKIGLLMLNKGQWAGKQIIPADWIESSITPHIESYGYLWWTSVFNYENDSYPQTEFYFASGNGGQRIYILPELDLVAVFTTSNYGKGIDFAPGYMLYSYVIPAIYDFGLE